MKAILASARDPAGQNIMAQLLKLFDFKRADIPNVREAYVCDDVLAATVDSVLQLTSLPIAVEEVIVASRHASESGKPTLTVHAPGEIEKWELAVASPPTIKSALKSLARMRDEFKLAYEVSLEATHHGPTKLGVPVTFVEVGSSQRQWQDEKAAEAAAHAIMEAVTAPIEGHQAIGFGGPHYAPRHTDIVLRTDVCIGHIIPKYVDVDEGLVRLAMERTRGGAQLFVLDWKGLGSSSRAKIMKIATKIGATAVRGHELMKEANI
jgi:D-aminoacyl-tRNA deacylase